jgi:hypothetical protein
MVLEIERNLRLNGRAKESKQPVVVAKKKKVQTPRRRQPEDWWCHQQTQGQSQVNNQTTRQTPRVGTDTLSI